MSSSSCKNGTILWSLNEGDPVPKTGLTVRYPAMGLAMEKRLTAVMRPQNVFGRREILSSARKSTFVGRDDMSFR